MISKKEEYIKMNLLKASIYTIKRSTLAVFYFVFPGVCLHRYLGIVKGITYTQIVGILRVS